MTLCEDIIAAETAHIKHAAVTIADQLAGISNAQSNCSSVKEHLLAARRLRVDIKNIGSLVAALHDAARAHEMIAVALEMKNGGEA